MDSLLSYLNTVTVAVIVITVWELGVNVAEERKKAWDKFRI